ncbi:hypothetical protein BH10PSE1_BH10PSE1_23480 [soil metagenome]
MLKPTVLALVFLCSAGPTAAQTASWTIEGTAGAVSDYRFRGYSLSDDKPALQAGLTAAHASGFYADLFVSTIAPYGLGADGDGARFEVTPSVGWAGRLAGFDVDASVAAYRYPDGDDVNYVELPVQVSRTVKDMTWTLGAAYAPEQAALGEEDNRYGWAGLDYAPQAWPISMTATVGYEDGAFAPEGKTDWRIGAERTVGFVTLGVSWVDSDATEGAVVGSVFANF